MAMYKILNIGKDDMYLPDKDELVGRIMEADQSEVGQAYENGEIWKNWFRVNECVLDEKTFVFHRIKLKKLCD